MAKLKQVAEIPHADRIIGAGEPLALCFQPRDPHDYPQSIRALKGRVAAWLCHDRGQTVNENGERLWKADDQAFGGIKVPEGDLRPAT